MITKFLFKKVAPKSPPAANMKPVILKAFDSSISAPILAAGGLAAGDAAVTATGLEGFVRALAPFAALAGYTTAFFVAAWWTVKGSRMLYRLFKHGIFPDEKTDSEEV